MAARQFWLTVVERPIADWPPSNHTRHWEVTLQESPTLQGIWTDQAVRTSPVFAATSEFSVPDFNSEIAQYIYYLCYDPAFRILGCLIRDSPPDLRRGLMFSLGLASTIIISSSPNLLAECETLTGTKPRSAEVWKIEKGLLTDIQCVGALPVEYSQDDFLVSPYDDLPVTQRAIVDEFVASIGLLIPRLAMHVPGELIPLGRIVGLVNELVREMAFVCRPTEPVPETLNEYKLADFENNAELTETILHQNAERLVQINAALSYLATQAISGAVPILERRSLIRRYSLLGVGSAILAILRIARSIESAFAKASLESFLADWGETSQALPGLDALPEYDAREWAKHSLGRGLGRVKARAPYPKIPYFSGRFGFRETEYTISASIHSLTGGAGPQWSLLTLTHEILHGHVRNLLSLVFSGLSIDPEKRWSGFYSSYAAHVQGSRAANENLLGSIRLAILAYCSLALTHGSLTMEGEREERGLSESKNIEKGFLLPTQRSLWLLLEREFRNISEVFVHVLDLHYFYQSAVDHYVPLIWNSWSTMPQVKGDPRQYLLRSLLVIAVKEKGTPYERFRIAIDHLRELLAPFAASVRTGAPTIRTVLAAIADRSAAHRSLFRPFSASLILADLADHVLFVPAIRGMLQGGDSHVTSASDPSSLEEWFDYSLGDGFEDDEVAAPAAFLAHRLAKALESAEPESLESTTVRTFLACCSHIAGQR